ncbi:hypothetical protein RFI_26327 [Reticulomyxa filosa]|uniref:Uncharacterized protein n=1 Tax=Reticulomyxa filosa TaxID=46433 RepID=X6MDC6_RETFI|nr:hypothetical protein RFI_26327 [Reticulomyxa filosa]|eukprot:ETO11050.1 hypothetical protein RFI_26327 [Reticulomyxa filosa]
MHKESLNPYSITLKQGLQRIKDKLQIAGNAMNGTEEIIVFDYSFDKFQPPIQANINVDDMLLHDIYKHLLNFPNVQVYWEIEGEFMVLDKHIIDVRESKIRHVVHLDDVLTPRIEKPKFNPFFYTCDLHKFKSIQNLESLSDKNAMKNILQEVIKNGYLCNLIHKRQTNAHETIKQKLHFNENNVDELIINDKVLTMVSDVKQLYHSDIHKYMGYPLQLHHICALLLYTEKSCNVEFGYDQMQFRHHKWKYLDMYLCQAISILHRYERREKSKMELYCGLKGVRLEDIEKKIRVGIFVCPITASDSLQIAQMNRGNRGCILHFHPSMRRASNICSCDVSWISSCKYMCEIVFSRLLMPTSGNKETNNEQNAWNAKIENETGNTQMILLTWTMYDQFIQQTIQISAWWNHCIDFNVIYLLLKLTQGDINEAISNLSLFEEWKLQNDNEQKYKDSTYEFMQRRCCNNHVNLLYTFLFDRGLLKKRSSIEAAILSTINNGLPFVEEDQKKQIPCATVKVNQNAIESLDLKKHCTLDWLNSNTEAAKIVKAMIQKREKGIVVVANNTCEWNDTKESANVTKTRKSIADCFLKLLNDNKTEKKQMGEYWLYVIKRKLIILKDVRIDGNVYVVNCKLKCKKRANITTQLYITKNATIDQKLKQFQLQELRDQYCQSLEKINLDNTLDYAQKCLDFCLDTFAIDHPFVADGHHNLGIAFYYKKEYDKAIECSEKALHIILNVFGVNHGWTANVEFDKNIEYQQKALQIRLNFFGNNHVDLGYSYQHFGDAYFGKKQYDDAITWHEKALQIRLDIFGENHNEVAYTYHILGAVYNEKKAFDKAMEYYEKALYIRLSIFGIDHITVSHSYQGFGDVSYGEQKYDDAIEWYEKALKIRLDTFGANHSDAASLYNILALSYDKKETYDKAIECHHKSLKIRLDISEIDCNGLIKAYNNLGESYDDKEQYSIAIECYEKALQVRLDTLGINHGDVADSYHNLAESYYQQVQYDKAIEFHQKALEIRINVFGNASKNVGESYWRLATIFEEAGENQTAVSILKINCNQYKKKGYLQSAIFFMKNQKFLFYRKKSVNSTNVIQIVKFQQNKIN